VFARAIEEGEHVFVKARDCRVLTDLQGRIEGLGLLGTVAHFVLRGEGCCFLIWCSSRLQEGCIHARSEDMHECCMYIAVAHALVCGLCACAFCVCVCTSPFEGLSFLYVSAWSGSLLYPAPGPSSPEGLILPDLSTLEKRAIYATGLSESWW